MNNDKSISRRGFLKTAAAIGAALTVRSRPTGGSASASSMRPSTAA